MATSISRIHAQIAKLQQQADTLKREAVKRVQQEVRTHGLTAEDIFGGGLVVGNSRNAKRASKASRTAKYGDAHGNVWGGMGKRPTWLRAALDAGAPLESFLLVQEVSSKATEKGQKTRTPAKRGEPRVPKKSSKAPLKVPAKAAARRTRKSASKPSSATN